MIAGGPSDGNWKDPRAHVSKNATHRSALATKAEERRIFGYMGGHLEAVRHVLPVSDWLGEAVSRHQSARSRLITSAELNQIWETTSAGVGSVVGIAKQKSRNTTCGE